MVNITISFFLGVSIRAGTVATTEVTAPGQSEVRIHLHVLYKHHTLVNLQAIGSEVSIETSDTELISHSEMVPIFTKSKNRPHFAALLVEQLIDESTRVRSNVRGRGKEQLDPTIIAYVKS